MDDKRITIERLIPLYRTGSRILVGIKEDYPTNIVKDGLVLEIDTKEKRIVNNPWSGQLKLKFSGYYEAIPKNEIQEVLSEIQEAFHETVIMEMVDLLLNPSAEAVESLIWIPERLNKVEKGRVVYKSLSDIQKQKFLEVSGKKYSGKELRGKLLTEIPYGDDKFDLSPYIFSWIFDGERGYFVCEMVHKFTNNQVYGWDYEGNELSGEMKSKYFESDGLGLKIVE